MEQHQTRIGDGTFSNYQPKVSANRYHQYQWKATY